MTAGARVESESPRRLAVAVRRLVDESERSASSAVADMRGEVAAVERELRAREAQLEQARRRLADAQRALSGCRARPGANCAAFERAVASAREALRRQEERVRVAQAALAEVRRQLDRLLAARARLAAAQRRGADGALRELTAASASLEAYLAGAPPSSGATAGVGASVDGGEAAGDGVPPRQFSADVVAETWGKGLATASGRAYYEADDHDMRALATSLQPFEGEYTVDMHGTPARVQVGDAELDDHQLAELVRADAAWNGRPVRLFSCNTGQGEHPIAAGLASELGVDVTAPTALACSNRAGESWVAEYEWKLVGGTMQRVPGPPQPDGWRTFSP